MKAYVIVLNNSPQHVVIGDALLAEVKLREMRQGYHQRHHPMFANEVPRTCPECSRCHWWTDEVPATHNPDW